MFFVICLLCFLKFKSVGCKVSKCWDGHRNVVAQCISPTHVKDVCSSHAIVIIRCEAFLLSFLFLFFFAQIYG